MMKTKIRKIWRRALAWLRGNAPQPVIAIDNLAEEAAHQAEAPSESFCPPNECTPPQPSQDSRLEPLCDALRRQGRLPASWEAMGIRDFMQRLAGDEAGLQWFAQFLESLPPAVALEECAAEEPACCPSAPTPSMPLRSQKRLDGRSVSLHRQALQLINAEPALSYAEALRRIS